MKRVGIFIAAILLIALVITAGWLGYTDASRPPDTGARPTPNPEVKTVPVERGDVRQVLVVPGEVVPALRRELGFPVGGRLAELIVRPGDTVTQGQTLAQLERGPLEQAVALAQADLTAAQDSLDKALHPYTELDLTQARLAVAQAELDLADTKENLEQVRKPTTELDLTEARLAVDQAKTKLEEAKENLASVKAGPTKAQLTSAEAALATAQENYERLLAGPDPEAVERAKFQLDQARNSLWSTQMNRDSVCGASARGDAPKTSCDSANAQVANAEISVQLAELSYQQAQAPATAAEIANAAAQVQQAEENLEQLRNSPTSLELAQAKAQVTQAEYDLAKAQETLAELEAGPDPLALSQAETQVAQAEYNLAKAKETLAEIEAGPDPKEIEVAQAKVVSAQATLEKAQADLAAATLVAPFGGTVLDVKAWPGDRINADAPLIELANLTQLEVRVTVGQEDITAVHAGQEARLIFDVLPEENFRGRVDRVIPKKTEGQVVTYEVFIALEGRPSGLLPGMTADAEIVIAERQDVLILPRRAIRARPNITASVPVLEAGQVVTRSVQIGLVGDLNAEILSGLQEGDRVVTER